MQKQPGEDGLALRGTTGREVAGAYMALDMYPGPQSLQEKAGSVVRLYDQLTADAVPG